MGEKLVEYMSNMMEKEALQKAGEMLEGGEEPLKILDHCRAAMEIVGNHGDCGQTVRNGRVFPAPADHGGGNPGANR